MGFNEIRRQVVGTEQSKKVRGEISLPNISGIPGIIVKDPVIAQAAMEDVRIVFAETYSMNGIEDVYLFERIDYLKQALRWSVEGIYSQDERTKVRKEAIDLMRSAAHLYSVSQERKANGNGGDGKVIFDSSQL